MNPQMWAQLAIAEMNEHIAKREADRRAAQVRAGRDIRHDPLDDAHDPGLAVRVSATVAVLAALLLAVAVLG
jgi:hypothetical protein